MTRRVAVLMGGWSSEREVSLTSGRAVVAALRERGMEPHVVDVDRNVASELAAISDRVDVVFNALHGRWGEDGCLQGLCELLGVTYTHSGVLASALAMNKPVAKRLYAAAGIPVAKGYVVDRETVLAGDPLPRPFVIKPQDEGSSVGVRIITEDDPPAPFSGAPWPYGETVLAEQYVPGREITVAVLGGRALGALEICPQGEFYDYRSKYTKGQSKYLVPAPVREADYAAALDHAVRAHDILGCRGVSRADFRYDDANGGAGLRLLEVNTQPGMTPGSLVPAIAAHAGISYADLVVWMVEDALCRP